MRRDARTPAAVFATAVGAGLAGVVAVVAIGAGASDLGDDSSTIASRTSTPSATALIPSGFTPNAPGSGSEAGATTAPPPHPEPVVVPAAEHPELTADEFGRLIDAVPLSGTHLLDVPPPITGAPAADDRIRTRAEARGYRLRPVASVPAVIVDGVAVHPDAAADLAALLAAARSESLQLDVRSGFRDVDQQRMIFERELASAAHRHIGRTYSPEEIAAGAADETIDQVLRYHSIPGYSRHHSGRAVDLHAGGELAAFEGSPAEAWLRADNFANAKRFGFVPSYPRGGGPQGPEPEPWEYVHIGVGAIRCAGLHIDLAGVDVSAACPLVAG